MEQRQDGYYNSGVSLPMQGRPLALRHTNRRDQRRWLLLTLGPKPAGIGLRPSISRRAWRLFLTEISFYWYIYVSMGTRMAMVLDINASTSQLQNTSISRS
jgi:hypothetical protein